MLIPKERLSHEALLGLVDSFVLQEGTDYGHDEPTLESKRAEVLRQLDRGEVVILFDPSTETCNLVTREELPKGAA